MKNSLDFCIPSDMVTENGRQLSQQANLVRILMLAKVAAEQGLNFTQCFIAC